MVAAEEDFEMKVKKKKKLSRWLLCSKFRSKNREIKPAPIEEMEKPTLSVEADKKKLVSPISRMTTDDKAVNQDKKEVSLPYNLKRLFTFCVGNSFSDN